ncbi:MAG: fibrobacter succinogenes major paralogous domain-containing protein [Bacteroidales bacterium]|nr:fibrobacter succinogenes major paralogous domain-containing protein [Bacteroidales bacterium]
MRNKTFFLIPLLLIGLIFVFANSCKKDDDNAGILALSTKDVTGITQTAAISGGAITSDGGATVTARGVCWSTDPVPTISDNKTADGTGEGSFVSNISELSPETTYYVRAYATNSIGTGYGSVISFTTQDNSPPKLLTTAVSNITNTTAASGGNIIFDGGATVTARGVCWSTDPVPTISDNKTTDGAGEGEFSSSLSGLSPETTYYVRAYATNSIGTGYGIAVTFRTPTGIFTDSRDDNVYQFVNIGNQFWMVENLKYLPNVDSSSTGSETTPHYYVNGYNGTIVTEAKATANYKTYGVLYNWAAAMSGATSSETNPSGVQGVCPTGWHIPSDAEWTELTDFLGGEEVAGGKLKETGTTHWYRPNTGATNETGFTALPGGFRDYWGLSGIGFVGRWWSATEEDASNVRYRYAFHEGSNFNTYYTRKTEGNSVRCVRD